MGSSAQVEASARNAAGAGTQLRKPAGRCGGEDEVIVF